MPRRAVSRDLKERIPILYHKKGYSIKAICDILGICKSLVYQTLKYHRDFGISHNPHARFCTGRPRLLDSTDNSFIKALLAQQHCMYIDEIQERLLAERGARVSIPTLVRTLCRLGLTHKCVSVRALERNAIQRSAFMNMIASEVPDPEMLMFIDEAAKNKRTAGRARGWALKGKRCIQRRCFVRGQRYSILPVLTLDGIITYDIIEGSVTAALFIKFLREFVVSCSSFTSNISY
jgi:transposase